MISTDIRERRRRHYVDQRIQLALLGGLVALEILLLVAGLLILDRNLNVAIEESLYRVHVAQPLAFPVLMRSALLVLVLLLAANAIALFVADRIWSGYVQRVLSDFRERIARIGRLDFSAADPAESEHEVSALVADWRETEASVWGKVRAHCAELQTAAAQSEPPEREELLRHLGALEMLLLRGPPRPEDPRSP